MMSFSCLQCGKCCRNLVFIDLGIRRGLTLFPEEIECFPEKLVEPYVGFGKRPYEPRFKVLAHQLTAINCIHLYHNKCSIYETRPTSCRQFPFSLDPDSEDILLGVDMNCPAAVQFINNSVGTIEFPDRESAEKLLALKKQFSEYPRKTWIFDLESEKWARYDKMI